MDFDISVLIAQDGITSGAIYAMMALGMVLVFNATRIIFVPFGDLAAYAALTLGYFQLHQRPGTIWFVAVLAIAAWALEVVALFWSGAPHRFWRATLLWLVVPLVPVGLAAITANVDLPPFVYLVLSVLMVLPIGPLLYRLVYQPIANASILLLLTVSVALHFALSGLALLCFGPEGLRTRSFLKGDFDVGGILVSGQMLTMVAAAALLSVVLYVFFDWTIAGKALRATAMNREGARLFQDPAKGQEIATQMYQAGVDYIQTDSAATDAGIIAAANEGAGRLVSAISPAQYKLGPKTVITLVGLDFGQSLYNEVTRTFDASWAGGHVATGLGTGVIDFVLSPVFQEQGPADIVAKAKAAWPQIEKAKAAILDGSLKVPFNTAL